MKYTFVYISDYAIDRIHSSFREYLDAVCCMTYNRQIVYKVNDRTLRKLRREYKEEWKGGQIKILD